MTEREFLARCRTARRAGLVRPETLSVLYRWTDLVFRLEGGQLKYVIEHLQKESHRTNSFGRTLANDPEGYGIIQLVAILAHPCQKCATDPQAWWTRPGWCTHKRPSSH